MLGATTAGVRSRSLSGTWQALDGVEHNHLKSDGIDSERAKTRRCGCGSTKIINHQNKLASQQRRLSICAEEHGCGAHKPNIGQSDV